MEIDKFIELVENMREAQSRYFKTRDKRALQRSIILENLCDKEIKEYRDTQISKIKEPDLFAPNGQ